MVGHTPMGHTLFSRRSHPPLSFAHLAVVADSTVGSWEQEQHDLRGKVVKGGVVQLLLGSQLNAEHNQNSVAQCWLYQTRKRPLGTL